MIPSFLGNGPLLAPYNMIVRERSIVEVSLFSEESPELKICSDCLRVHFRKVDGENVSNK